MQALVCASAVTDNEKGVQKISFSIHPSMVESCGWKNGDIIDVSIDGTSAVLFPDAAGRTLSKHQKASMRSYIRYSIPADNGVFKDCRRAVCTGVEQKDGLLAFRIPDAMFLDVDND
jgi:hypothetical protein